MIRYSDIEGLPDHHPLVKKFMAECDQHQTEGELLCQGMNDDLHDEESVTHFNRFIAGDRK